MSRDRRNLLIAIVATSISIGVTASTAQAGPASYTIDILSTDRYPQVQDSFMMRINDRGVAAGYIATASVLGPYLPTTYAGGGQFHSLGNESVGAGNYFGLVTGLNDRGAVVGNVTNADGSYTPYVERGGVVQTITLPSNAGTGFAEVLGIGANGLAYGQYTDQNGLGQVFTTTGSVSTQFTLPNSPYNQYFIDTTGHLMSSAGILGIYAEPPDYSSSPALLYDTKSGSVTELATPQGYGYDDIYRLSTTGVYGAVTDANFNVLSLASWNLDGTFRGLIDLPSNLPYYEVQFNDLGQAIGLTNDRQLMYFDGTSWSSATVAGLGNYTLSNIEDFNDRGDFVGLAFNAKGFEFGYVATAVPEPTSLAPFGTGLAAVGFCGMRQRRRPSRRRPPTSGSGAVKERGWYRSETRERGVANRIGLIPAWMSRRRAAREAVRAGVVARLLTLLAVAMLPTAAPARAGTSYTVTILGTLSGDYSEGWGVNNAGQVAGDSGVFSIGSSEAFLSGGGGAPLEGLGTLGGADSLASAVNDSGQVVGYSSVADQNDHAYLSAAGGGALKDLGTLPGGVRSVARGVNASGQVAGSSATDGFGANHAFLSGPNGGALKDLGTLGGSESLAYGVNSSGQVSGYSELAGDTGRRAFVSGPDGGPLKDLGTLGGNYSLAWGVNDSGQVTGNSTLAGDAVAHAILTGADGADMKDLGTLGGENSYGYTVNDAGQVVGVSELAPGDDATHAFLYSGGQMIDLNSVISPLSGITLVQALGISDSGFITGVGVLPDGSARGFLLTPTASVPEPSSLVEAAVGMAVAGMTLRRRPRGASQAVEIAPNW